jgi:hypothetical protein
LTNICIHFPIRISDSVFNRSFSTYKRFDPIHRLISLYRPEKKALKTASEFSLSVITSRKNEQQSKKSLNNNGMDTKKSSLLDTLLESSALTNEEICEEVDTFMFEVK